MKKTLENLRARPNEEKKRLAKTMVLVATGMIVIQYLVITFTGKSRAPEPGDPSETNTSFIDAIGGLIDSGINSISSQADEATTGFDNIVEDLENLEEIQTESEADIEASQTNPGESGESTQNL